MMRLESRSFTLVDQRQPNKSATKTSNFADTINGTSRSQKLKLTASTLQKGDPVEFSSNLEFTSSSRAQPSLAYFRPDILNLTPQKTPIELIKVAKEVPQNKHSFQSQTLVANNNIKEKRSSSVESVSSSESIPENDKIRLHNIWPGKNRFCFGGRFITGPKSDRIAHVIFWCFFLAISTVFFALVFKFLLMDVNFLLPYVSVYLFLSTILFFLLVSFTDPGIIPRKSVWELSGNMPAPYSGTNNSNQTLNQFTTLDMTKNKSLSKEAANVSFCQICNIYKTPQTVHCQECDNCVEMFVYHSHILGNCIGKRNYRFFIGFIVSLSLLSISYACSFMIMIIIATGCDPNKEPSNLFKTTTVTIITVLLFIIPSVILLCMKLALLYQYIKDKLKRNPTRKNIDSEIKNRKHLINLISWLGTTPSLFNPRQPVSQEEFFRFHAVTKCST